MGLFRPLVTKYESPQKTKCRDCDGTGEIIVTVGTSRSAEKTVKCKCGGR